MTASFAHRARAALVAVLLLAIPACAVKLPGTGEPAQLYVLTPKSTYPADLPKVDWQLLIEQTTSPAGLDSARIAVAYSPTELDYFARANWTDRAPQMVQRLIIESFENSGRIVAVGRDAIGLRSDLLLKTDLREFQAEYKVRPPRTGGTDAGAFEGDPPTIRVRIGAKLVRMPQRIIVASKTFEHTATANENTMRGIVSAFDQALGRALQDVVFWTLVEGNAIIRDTRG